jgi:hypothetical protein
MSLINAVRADPGSSRNTVIDLDLTKKQWPEPCCALLSPRAAAT